jgi:hypothetical protein
LICWFEYVTKRKGEDSRKKLDYFFIKWTFSKKEKGAYIR